MYCILPTNTTFRKERTQIQYQGTFLLRGKKGCIKVGIVIYTYMFSMFSLTAQPFWVICVT